MHYVLGVDNYDIRASMGIFSNKRNILILRIISLPDMKLYYSC